jgi:hypothetical protein
VTEDRATWTYDDKRMSLTTCACGREVSNGAACQGVCLMARREQQIAGIRQRQEERRMAAEGV